MWKRLQGVLKPFKPEKLPKNFIALDYAQRHHEMIKKSNFCPHHPKELMKHFCNTCMRLICVECIVAGTKCFGVGRITRRRGLRMGERE